MNEHQMRELVKAVTLAGSIATIVVYLMPLLLALVLLVAVYGFGKEFIDDNE